jgi:hypothetical protein
MIFHRVGASFICISGFTVFIWWGFFKLILWHFPRMLFTGNRESKRFVYHYSKALDSAACAGAFGGKCDETISCKAGKVFQQHRFNSPLWVIVVKKLTDRWEPDHIQNAVEPCRSDPKW